MKRWDWKVKSERLWITGWDSSGADRSSDMLWVIGDDSNVDSDSLRVTGQGGQVKSDKFRVFTWLNIKLEIVRKRKKE